MQVGAIEWRETRERDRKAKRLEREKERESYQWRSSVEKTAIPRRGESSSWCCCDRAAVAISAHHLGGMKRTKKNYEESVVRSLIPGHVSASLVRPGTGRHWGLGGGGGCTTSTNITQHLRNFIFRSTARSSAKLDTSAAHRVFLSLSLFLFLGRLRSRRSSLHRASSSQISRRSRRWRGKKKNSKKRRKEREKKPSQTSPPPSCGWTTSTNSGISRPHCHCHDWHVPLLALLRSG